MLLRLGPNSTRNCLEKTGCPGWARYEAAKSMWDDKVQCCLRGFKVSWTSLQNSENPLDWVIHWSRVTTYSQNMNSTPVNITPALKGIEWSTGVHENPLMSQGQEVRSSNLRESATSCLRLLGAPKITHAHTGLAVGPFWSILLYSEMNPCRECHTLGQTALVSGV